MKKFYTLFFTVLLAFNSNSQVSFCDDFEGYSNGIPIAETSKNWNTWDELMNGSVAPFIDDANVVNTQFNGGIPASSGSNGLYLTDATGTGGPQDLVLMFDTIQNIINSGGIIQPSVSTPYTTGSFNFSQMMYIIPGKTGYFNFQAENIPGISWALEVNFDAAGGILMSNTSGTTFNCTYPAAGTWFEIAFNIDLSNNIWEVFIDSVSQGSFSNSINKIASIDLFPAVSSEYYVDDICYSYDTTQIVLPNLDLAVSNIASISGLDGQNRDVTVEVINLGINTITSFDIDFLYNGNTISDNISGLNLQTGASMPVTLTSPIVLSSGTYPCTATISNVNGMPFDDNPSNDISTSQIITIAPTPDKLVIGEEATGTWCGWCPRGAVALNYMDRDYHGYFQGIAVHNGDPMTNTDYDNGLAPYIGGYPSALVDRGSEIDPSEFEQYFMQEIINPISATFTGNAVATGNVIDVEISTTVTSAISGNWTFACVLVEDSVTGTGGTWYQSNSYGANGLTLIDVDGTDWGTLPNWVPDYQMIYRHVAREIQPSFGGGPLPSSTYNVGAAFTQNFQFTTDPTWDINSMNVVGMLLNPNGMVDNAVSLPVSINNNPSSVENVSSTTSLNIYPNPAVSTTTLLMTLDTEEEVSISIKSIEGRLIAKGEYGTMIGSHSLTFDVAEFANGVYIIEAIIGNEVIVKKFIKE
jgi:hypothetical protein